jgi:opacity protein-like surface antigen
LAVSAFVLTAGVALAGGPGKRTSGCPEACQKQIDDLNSSQAQQDEKLRNHEGRITDLENAFNDAWYIRLGVRAAWMNGTADAGTVLNRSVDVTSDVGWGGAIAFGREFSMYKAPGKFRAEVELAKQRSNFKETVGLMGPVSTGQGNLVGIGDGTVDVSTIFINGYYEQPIVDGFSVYVMAGLGYAKFDVSTDLYGQRGSGNPFHVGKYDFSDNLFAYKLGTGVTYNFTNQMAVDLGYEYLGVAESINGVSSINGHNIVLSFRFKF